MALVDIMVDLQETQFVVIFSPNLSHIAAIEKIVKASDLRPILLINPDWPPTEKEGEGSSRNSVKSESFLEPFEVIYSYLPLLIQGFFSKTQGAVVKQSMGNASSSPGWFIYVNEGDTVRCVSNLRRP